MKTCGKCGLELSLDSFCKDKHKSDGLSTVCRKCRSAYVKRHYRENAERRKAESREWYHQNRERASAARKGDYIKNIDVYRARRKAAYWSDPESAKEAARKYSLKRRWEDPLYRVVLRCRKRVWEAHSRKGYTKRSKTFSLIGCSQEALSAHLESMFVDGMTWGNYGEWHVDHVIPLSSAASIEEVEALCHFSNLQPLWAADNLRKGAKIDYGED